MNVYLRTSPSDTCATCKHSYKPLKGRSRTCAVDWPDITRDTWPTHTCPRWAPRTRKED